jgi:Uma2 family endonuclease
MNPTLATMPEVVPANGVDTEGLYEVIDGQRKELPPIGASETNVANVLWGFLIPFARTQNLGRAVGEMLFNFAAINKQRRPDVAFVSYQRWPKAEPVPVTNAWDVVPDLAVEVVSPTETMVQVLEKVREYFQVGVHLVWLVLPPERLIYIYHSPTQIQVLTHADALSGEAVVPGFQIPVATLFEDMPPPG